MTQIISVVQQKGGAGKSTLISCLAVKMAQDGARVVIVDTDPQGHCVEWAGHQEAVGDLDVVDHLEEDRLELLLDKLAEDYDVILIDTAGFDSRMSTYVIQMSDLILIPTGASKKDVNGAVQTYLHVGHLTKRLRDQPITRL